jgi:hypothetical protein
MKKFRVLLKDRPNAENVDAETAEIALVYAQVILQFKIGKSEVVAEFPIASLQRWMEEK